MTGFSARSLYEVIDHETGETAYAERILLFDLDESDLLPDAAENEIAVFLERNPHYRRVGDITFYRLSNSAAFHPNGKEVWSMLYSGETKSEFLKTREQILPPHEG